MKPVASLERLVNPPAPAAAARFARPGAGRWLAAVKAPLQGNGLVVPGISVRPRNFQLEFTNHYQSNKNHLSPTSTGWHAGHDHRAGLGHAGACRNVRNTVFIAKRTGPGPVKDNCGMRNSQTTPVNPNLEPSNG